MDLQIAFNLAEKKFETKKVLKRINSKSYLSGFRTALRRTVRQGNYCRFQRSPRTVDIYGLLDRRTSGRGDDRKRIGIVAPNKRREENGLCRHSCRHPDPCRHSPICEKNTP